MYLKSQNNIQFKIEGVLNSAVYCNLAGDRNCFASPVLVLLLIVPELVRSSNHNLFFDTVYYEFNLMVRIYMIFSEKRF
jgi:hypothetical protein